MGTLSSLLIYMILGGVAGWLASRMMKKRGYAPWQYILIGMVGAVIGGIIFKIIGFIVGGIVGSLVIAVIGSMVLIFLVDKLKSN
ncbi:GlsB/YeaQ/YmgE family stress response membrane protein [Ectothiorhodospiraceae bacterium BW-2]|nr:GlsB/YeaQ/YmgE family stress response membrane protein [Ectothiorhodospiraceae bacterium BW-2]